MLKMSQRDASPVSSYYAEQAREARMAKGTSTTGASGGIILQCWSLAGHNNSRRHLIYQILVEDRRSQSAPWLPMFVAQNSPVPESSDANASSPTSKKRSVSRVKNINKQRCQCW